MKTMDTAPKDGSPILLNYEGKGWIQGCWSGGDWRAITLDSHGCGCCAEQDPDPIGWDALP